MASRKAASLYIDVGASTAKLTGGLAKAKAKVNQFKRSSAKSFGIIKKAVLSTTGALVALAGVGGLGLLIKSAMKTADEIGKMSDRLNMSAEGFQALHHQAGLFGVSAEMVNSSVERMVKRLGEAANGTGAAKKELDNLNISAKELIGLNADEQYAQIAEAIGGLSTQAEKAAATAAIFGREGIKMLSMFNDGKQGIADARAELDEFGIAMDRVQIKKIENANDAFHRVSAVIKAAGRIIAAELSPYLEAAAKQFLEMAKQAGGFGEITNSASAAAITAIGGIITFLDYMRIGWETLRLGVLAFAATTTAVLNKLNEDTKTTARWFAAYQQGHIGFIEWFTTGGGEASKKIKNFSGNVRKEIGFLQTVSDDFINSAIESQVNLVELIGNVGKNADIAKGKLLEIKKAADEVAQIQVNKFNQDQDTPEAAAEAIKITKEAEQQAINEAAALKWAHEETERQRSLAADEQAHQAKVGFAKQTAGNLSSLMSAQSKKLFKIGKAAAIATALINVYQAVTRTMAETPYPWNIPLAIAQGVAGAVQVQNIRSQQYSGAREFGGSVVKDRSYLVGERGAEIFTPGASGNITSNRDIGGGDRAINLSFNTIDTGSIEKLFTENRELLYNTMLDAMDREGRSFG